MIRSEKIDQVLEAYQRARPNFGSIKKDKKGAFNEYTTWEILEKAVTDALLVEKISMIFRISPTFDFLELILEHQPSGQYFGTVYPIFKLTNPKLDPNQAYGGGVTYAKRYALPFLMGLSHDAEIDPDDIETVYISARQMVAMQNVIKQLKPEDGQKFDEWIMNTFKGYENIPLQRYEGIYERIISKIEEKE